MSVELEQSVFMSGGGWQSHLRARSLHQTKTVGVCCSSTVIVLHHGWTIENVDVPSASYLIRQISTRALFDRPHVDTRLEC